MDDQRISGDTSIPNGLVKLVNSFKFKRENYIPHIIPGIMLIISLPTYASLIYNILLHGDQDTINYWYASLAAVYFGYVLSSSISAYRLLKITHNHLVNSGITSYYWLKKLDDYDSIIKLYRSSIMRRDLPSPLTGLIVTLLSAGIAYPVILYMVDKIMRDHYYGEEEKFLNAHLTSRINVEHGLMYIAATMLTIGLYLIIWDYMVVKNYNKHIKLIHGNHPELPSSMMTRIYGEYTNELPILAVALTFIGAGIYGLLSMFGFPCHLSGAVGYGLLIAGVAAYYRDKGIISQIGKVYVFIYLSFILFAIVGYSGVPAYYRAYEEITEELSQLRTDDLFVLTRNIFVNNLAISLVSVTPFIGPLYLGIGLGNAGLYYGVVINLALSRGNPTVLLLPIMPHTILEFLAYAFFASLSMRIFKEKESKIAVYFLLSVLILLTAALVESLTIISVA